MCQNSLVIRYKSLKQEVDQHQLQLQFNAIICPACQPTKILNLAVLMVLQLELVQEYKCIVQNIKQKQTCMEHDFLDSVDNYTYILSSCTFVCLVQWYTRSLPFGCLFRFKPNQPLQSRLGRVGQRKHMLRQPNSRQLTQLVAIERK